MTETVISIKEVSKDFRYYNSNHQRVLHELFGRDTGAVIPALRDISLDISRGEKVGLLGTVGAGRTTLQRLIAGIIEADTGTVTVSAPVTGVFDYKTGMNATFTVRENICMHGAIIGWSKEQTAEHLDSIAQYSEVGDALDVPVGRCRVGTPTFIGFAMATEMKPEILVFDENLTFGRRKDFREKSLNRLQELVSADDVTLVLTVNSPAFAKKVCTRGIVMDKGRILFDGSYKAAHAFFHDNVKADPEEEKAVKERAKGQDKRESNVEVDEF